MMDYLEIQTQEEVFQILENNLQEPVLLPKVQYFAQETFEQYRTKPAFQKEAVSFPEEPIREQEGESMKNEPQLDIDLNWMSNRPIERFKDKDVTTYLEEVRNQSLINLEKDKKDAFQCCSSFQEALLVLIRFAEELNCVEEDYYDLTHLDTLYIPAAVDEIAFQHREELRPFAEPDTDLTLAVAKALKKADHPLSLLERQKDVYERIQVLPEQIQNQFQNYSKIERRVHRVHRLWMKYTSKLESSLDQVRKLEKEKWELEKLPRFRKFWKRGRLQDLSEEIKRVEEERSTWHARRDNLVAVYGKKQKERVIDPESFHYPWEDYALDPPHSIRTEEDVEKTMEEIRQYGKQPEVQEAYRAAVRILDAVERTEFPSFAEERERNKQASFPEKENERKISSELEQTQLFRITRIAR